MNLTSRFLIGVACIAISAISARADIDRVVEKSFAAHPGDTLVVTNQGGGIRVETSSDGTVKVTAEEHIAADTDAEADALLAKLTLTIEQQANGVSANAKYDDQPSEFHLGSWPPVRVEFTIAVPARYNVDLRTSGGGIGVDDLGGNARLRASSGSMKLGKISGDVDATTSGGGIRLAEGGARVSLTASSGSVFVGRAVGPADIRTSGGGIQIDTAENTAEAHTSSGSMKLGQISGDVDATTSGGRIRLATGGAKVRLQASSGSVYIGRVVGPADVRTSGGGIQIDAAENTLTARTSSGSLRAAFVGPLKGDCSLSTSGGGIKVAVEPGTGFDLDASASGGEVETRDVSVTLHPGTLRRSNLIGIVGAGGPLLRLRSSSGSIVIETSH